MLIYIIWYFMNICSRQGPRVRMAGQMCESVLAGLK